jgi:hypothetical protein
MYYSSATQINSALCQQQSLKVYSIALGDSSSLFQPLPLFYMQPQCSAGVGFNATSSSDKLQFPSFLDSSDPLVIGTAFQFPSTTRIHSIYVPPGVKVTSYKLNPSTTLDSANPKIEFGPNTLVIDTCYQNLKLSNGDLFFAYKDGSMTSDYWYSKWIQQTESKSNLTDLNFSIADLCQDDNITHNSTYWKVEIITPFKNLLRDVCRFGTALYIGDHDMREYYYPQSPSCDQLMFEYCQTPPTDPDNNTCKCYVQQQLLDKKFHEDLRVPVTCFGHLVATQTSNKMFHSCANDSGAYKSKAMVDNTCQHTLCEQDADEHSIIHCEKLPKDMFTMLADVQTKSNELNIKAKQTYEKAKQTFIENQGVNQPTNLIESKTSYVAEEYTEKPKIAWIIILIGIILLVLSFFITLLYSAYFTTSFGTDQLILDNE